MSNLDEISEKLLILDGQIANLEKERSGLREEALEWLSENGGKYMSSRTGYEMVRNYRKGLVNEEAFKVVLGSDLYEQATKASINMDLVRALIARGDLTEKQVDGVREQGSWFLTQRRTKPGWTA